MPWNDKHPDVSIVIPVYRAADQLKYSLQQLEAFIRRTPLGIQVVLIDDGSGDETTELLLAFAAERDAVVCITHQKNLGKGRAVSDGVAAATASIIVFTDIDIPYELSIVESMHKKFTDDPRISMLVGSRHHRDSVVERPYGVSRRISSWAFGRLARAVSHVHTTDVQCGIKAFRYDAARLLFSDLVVSRFAFDVELFIRAKNFNIKFEEMPVVFRHVAHSTIRILPTSTQMIKDLWRLYVAYRKK